MKYAKKAAVVATGIALMFGTANMTEAFANEAASNSAQEMTTNTLVVDKEAVEAAKAELSQKLQEKNTGDTYLLYVSNPSLNGGSTFLYYLDMFKFTNYDDYLNQAAQLQGPVLQKPDGLPEGYKFENGNIQAPIAKHLKEFQQEVKAEAQAQGKGVHYKKFDWNEMGEINLTFVNGKDNLEMQVTHKLGRNTASSGYRFIKSNEVDAEQGKMIPGLVRNKLIWSDQDHLYSITTNLGNPLTKEDLIKFAETAVKK
ncbi:hypothetical protein PAALTS15_27961 [Paenibacillus alvei TS-15]|uniref:DUF4367 domain-containing protein n=1 Tax=Paenibacillus alvei TS-15 TaxID=1117108 RepID=S9SFZ9_PAEAL|nr:hypothetical protein [Paenibacillus alvei]EPY03664.1 hypothetical protein PAALTS15_27961 [Paenibacillus alvei TS-15]